MSSERPIMRNSAAVAGTARSENAVEKLAMRTIREQAAHPFCFRRVTCRYDQGVLTLHGRVATFYLKQVLQTLLMDLDGVRQIDNEVEVVDAAELNWFAGGDVSSRLA